VLCGQRDGSRRPYSLLTRPDGKVTNRLIAKDLEGGGRDLIDGILEGYKKNTKTSFMLDMPAEIRTQDISKGFGAQTCPRPTQVVRHVKEAGVHI
jgi:hypothetical protein